MTKPKPIARPAPPLTASTVGRETLDETPQRVLKLLRGVGTSPAIRAAFAARGYSEEDHEEGWTLLHDASGYVPHRPFAAEDVSVRDAIRAVDAWDEGGFRVVRASLERRFPAVAARVLGGLRAATGIGAVLGVALLLDRLDELEKGKHKDDLAALALLAKRGIDKGERERLRALVEKAQSVSADVAGALEDDVSAVALHERRVQLIALRRWYEEWASIARASIKRRDHLIFLGLATRKPPERRAAPPKPASKRGGAPSKP